MKRLLSAIVVAVAMSANAVVTWEKIGGIQVVDATGLTSAVMRLGEISGNSMVGAMLATKIMEMPSNGFFGPMRQGASLYFPLYVDSDKLADANDAEDFGNAVEHAVVYPMALPKEEFIGMHPGAVETNGMLLVEGEMFTPEEEWDEDSQVYVVFSEDGRWAAASDRPEQAVIALGDVALASRPMTDDIVRLELSPRGVAAFCKVIDNDAQRELLSGLDGVSSALRIGDAGVDIHGYLRTAEGSQLSKYGEVQTSGDPFAFDNGESVAALSDSLADQSGFAADVRAAMEICRTNGFDVAQFMSCIETANLCRITVDIPAAIRYFTNPSNKVDTVDVDKLFAALTAEEEMQSTTINPATGVQNISVVFAGYRPAYSASQRFAAVLPELKGRPLCYAGTYSICASVQAGLEAALASMDDKKRAEIAPMVALFPKESAGGVATAYWRDGQEIRFILRLSADELRRVTTGASAIFMYMMMRENERRYEAIDEECGEDCSFCDDDDDIIEDYEDEDEEDED